ncbi:baseplate J/gp47 family protein [Paenibacillus sp. strain BS8-2]
MLDANGFKRRRFAEIYADMEAKAKEAFGQQINTGERSAIGIMLRLVAFFLGRLWQSLEDVYYSGHVHSATGRNLDRVGANYNTPRTLAQQSTGYISVTGTPLHILPAGFRMQTPAGVVFETLTPHTLSGSGSTTCPIRAVESGVSGNVEATTITIIVNPDADITAVSNAAATSGGLDTESDPVYRDRILTKIQNPGTSGNAADYLNWALEVTGVGKAKVFPLWAGPGTVRVVLADTERMPASPDIVAATIAHIEQSRPVGAAVTVQAASAVEIDVVATVVLSPGTYLQEVTEEFESILDDYLKENALIAEYVSIARIGTLLLGVKGVLDYNDMTLNGSTSNLALEPDEMAVAGSLTLEV